MKRSRFFVLLHLVSPLASSMNHLDHSPRKIHHKTNTSPSSEHSFIQYRASPIDNKLSSVITMSARRERRGITGYTATQQLNQIISAEETARQKRSGQAKRRLERAARRENRIAQLEIMDSDGSSSSDNSNNGLTDSERAELEGLLRTRENFEEQYHADTFSEEHVEFKRLHNEAFAALARFCQQDRNRRNTATSLALIDKHGFDPSCCYVANRHLSTYKILQQCLPEENVIHATAAEALTPPCSNASDCNNDSNDYDAALIRPEETTSSSSTNNLQHHLPKTTAIGYSLMGGNKDVIEKEMDINRALSNIARTRGMRTRHVLDDPWRYGVPAEIAKTEGGTFTSWMLLEEEEV
ncbi:hypothetical protein QTG54_009173 [Skeletonema marinoi]|uniref:Uncharacterized protein n=1 Tax=Skeletonema marinoi TaxID=267567 RepID=A0AAD8Y6R8_9STRA|nr:hypothetical protein QTG54_009173 [Skeletonema marinoi]